MNQTTFRGPEDVVRMLAAARKAGDHIHAVDMPYRLSSWALDRADTVALWEDGGAVVGWAALQTPFWALDYAIAPAAARELLPAVLAWAEESAGRLLATGFGRPAWFAAVAESNTPERAALEGAGFADQSAAAEPWSQVTLRRDGAEPVPPVRLRPGFTIRELGGAAEVPAYVALHRAVFGTENMTAGWRAATLRAPGYRPEFDLVAVDPDGQLAAFGIGWFQQQPDGRAVAQVEPFGVRSDARRYGLAWALMFELLRRFAAAGAAEVRVMTDSYRDAAYAFYQGCGFQPVERVLMYRKDYA